MKLFEMDADTVIVGKSSGSISTKDWEDQKFRIEKLYWIEDRELSEVRDIMKANYGFTAT